VAGDGSEREGLEALAAGLGVSDSCEFLGARADVEGFQRRAAILLAPRPDEPFGLSVVEAMAAGTPVVAAAGGGHLETVGQCPGAVLYPPRDTAGAGRLLAELAADPARRACYGEALRATHRRAFLVEPQVRATLDLYRAVLA
jgi:glycosyltransferase involved in cell wall biosynthesis